MGSVIINCVKSAFTAKGLAAIGPPKVIADGDIAAVARNYINRRHQTGQSANLRQRAGCLLRLVVKPD